MKVVVEKRLFVEVDIDDDADNDAIREQAQALAEAMDDDVWDEDGCGYDFFVDGERIE